MTAPTWHELGDRYLAAKQAVPPRGGGRDAKRTARNNAMIAAGVHPATKMSLRGDDETCGSCAHAISRTHQRTYWKCDLLPITAGPGSDIRKKWPACTKWEPADV